ncbi:MAG: hypothetical protein M3R17_06250 [Bacteroidota bacterium]|nr:hypothetical protein [Bacteroidota bacterium]
MENKKKSEKKPKVYACTDPQGDIVAVNVHQISEEEFNSMVKKFYGTTNHTPKTLNLTDASLDLTLDCKTNFIQLAFNDSIQNDNDIASSMSSKKYYTPTMEKGIRLDTAVKYSIQLFKGLKNNLNVHHLELCKAKEKNGSVIFAAVVFKAYVLNIDAPVYYGNLTSQIPLHPRKKTVE